MASRRGRVLGLLLGALAVLLLLQTLGQGLLNLYAVREFGPGAGTFHVRLWRLAVFSEEGSATLGTLRLGWTGARFSLLTGRLRAEGVTLAEGAELLAEAEGLEARQLYTSADVRLRHLRLDLTRTGWRAVGDSLPARGSSPPSGAGAWPALWIPEIDLETPLGKAEGRLTGWPGSDRWHLAAELRQEVGTHLQLEGHLSADGGVVFINGELSGLPMRAEGSGRESLWTLMGTFQTPFAQWDFDGRVSGSEQGQILLRNRSTHAPTEWLSACWSMDHEVGRVIPALITSEGGIDLTSLGFGQEGSQGRWKLTVGTSHSGHDNQQIEPCIFASVFLGASGLAQGGQAREALNLNWSPEHGASLGLSATFGSGDYPSLEYLGDRVSLSTLLEGLWSPEMTLRGALDADLLHLELLGEGSSEDGTAQILAAGRLGRWKGTLSWFPSGWKSHWEGEVHLPDGAQLPLPAGRWSLQVDLVGRGFRLDGGSLAGRCLPGGLLAGRYEGGALEVSFEGTPAASWGQLGGTHISLKGPWDGTLSLPEAFLFEGRCATLQAGEFRATALRASGTLTPEALAVAVSVELPSLGGRASGRLTGPLGDPSRLALGEGRLEILDGALVVESLQADGFLGKPGQYALWRAPRATFKEIPLAGLTGRLADSAGDGGLLVEGRAEALGGTLALAVRPAAGEAALQLEGRGLDARAVDAAVTRFQALPFTATSGQMDLAITAPLVEPGPGWHLRVIPSGATLSVPDDRHQFRGVQGTVLLDLTDSGAELGSEGLALEGGKVPVTLDGAVSTSGGRVQFSIPPGTAREVQNALFDFLPEFIGYGDVTGRLGLEGSLVPPGKEAGLLRVRALLQDAGFRSEDGSLRLEGMEGALALSVPVGGEGPSLRGYQPPGPEGTTRALDRFSDPLLPGDQLAIRRIAFSVYRLEGATLSSADGADGMTRLRLTRGRLFDGEARAEFALAVGAKEIRYAGQVLLDHASLAEFCRQSEGMIGSLSGRFSASVTFAADRLGLGALKALVDLAVDPAGGEPLLLGRDFLTQIGGDAMRKLVTRSQQPYDQASLQVGVRSGTLTVRNLVLEHQANPLKASIRRDLSFELKMPANNAISLYHLLDLVKRIQDTSVQVGSP